MAVTFGQTPRGVAGHTWASTARATGSHHLISMGPTWRQPFSNPSRTSLILCSCGRPLLQCFDPHLVFNKPLLWAYRKQRKLFQKLSQRPAPEAKKPIKACYAPTRTQARGNAQCIPNRAGRKPGHRDASSIRSKDREQLLHRGREQNLAINVLRHKYAFMSPPRWLARTSQRSAQPLSEAWPLSLYAPMVLKLPAALLSKAPVDTPGRVVIQTHLCGREKEPAQRRTAGARKTRRTTQPACSRGRLRLICAGSWSGIRSKNCGRRAEFA